MYLATALLAAAGSKGELNPLTFPSEDPKATPARTPCSPGRRGSKLAGILG